jgi:hypothetical protein
MRLFLAGDRLPVEELQMLQDVCAENNAQLVDPYRETGPYDILSSRNLQLLHSCDLVFVIDYEQCPQPRTALPVKIGRWVEAFWAKRQGKTVVIWSSPSHCATIEENPYVNQVSHMVKEWNEGNVRDVIEPWADVFSNPQIIKRGEAWEC